MFKFQKRGLKVLCPTLESREGRRAARWRIFGYGAVVLWFFATIVAAWLRPELNRPEIPDWRPVLALADAAWERGDLYQARHLYVQVERVAASNYDWQGLVAAACGFRKLDDLPTRYSKSYTLLVRATILAEEKQSRQGMITIAKAFTIMGQDKTASLFLARIRAEWPIDKQKPLEFPLRACKAEMAR